MAHALLSASSSHRWLSCTPSARLEEAYENKSSSYAEEGTAAHALAEHKLRKFLEIPTKRPISTFDSPELECYTDAYVEYACELISEAYARSEDALVLVEQRLDYSKYAPEGFGTGDLVIISEKVLDIVDLKYGKGVKVSAENNSQLKLYALGALEEFGYLYDIETVRLTICQPRLDNFSTYELSAKDLMYWAESELRPKAALAYKGEGETKAGDHCRWCLVGPMCRARAERNLELAKLDFKEPDLLTDDEIAEVLTKLDELKSWATEVWEYAQAQAIAGQKTWTGFKVVEGRSNRKFTDEEKVAETLIETGQFTEETLYTRKLIGLSEMEKALGKKKLNELLREFITKPPGKPTLVVSTDKRKEWDFIASAIKDFE